MAKKMVTRGYLSARKERNKVIVCYFDGESKRYLTCGLDEALEVLTGRRAFVPLKELVRHG